MPEKLPERVYRHGLTTHHAFNKLINHVDRLLEERCTFMSSQSSLSSLSFRALRPDLLTNVYPLTTVVASLALCTGVWTSGALSGDETTKMTALALTLLLLFNIWASLKERNLYETERLSRLRHVLKRLREVRGLIHWTASAGHYPHLHTPLSNSIVLQWTVRDRKHVNLPWALLVESDVVLIKPGQAAPGRCHGLDDSSVVLESGDVLHVKPSSNNVSDTRPQFKTPATPQLFVMDETPYLKVVKQVLEDNRLFEDNDRRDEDEECRESKRRPPSVLYRHLHLLFVRILVHTLLPSLVTVVLLWRLIVLRVLFREDEEDDVASSWSLFFSVMGLALPLLPLSLPFFWTVTNHLGLAWVLCVHGASKHVRMTSSDPFDDKLEQEQLLSKNRLHAIPWLKLRNTFYSSLIGTGEYLSRTENVLHAFGSITALCCTDKRGILSWPNASPEKVFFLRPEENENCNDIHLKSSRNLVPEILNLTHDPHNPFDVAFDDPTWSRFSSALKPLGLSILLNTCNITTEEKYTSFFNHLVCESMHAEVSANARSTKTTTTNAQHVDVLPIVTRGCLCRLAAKLGFRTPTTVAQYNLSSQIQLFRHVRVDNQVDKFAKNLSLARLKFPFPHVVSVAVQHRASGSRHLISQGTADILLDSCIDCWTGSDLEPLSGETRKRILDFYQRASLSSYCTAYAYRPLTYALPWRNVHEFLLQLPTHTNQFYWQYNVEQKMFLQRRRGHEDDRDDDEDEEDVCRAMDDIADALLLNHISADNVNEKSNAINNVLDGRRVIVEEDEEQCREDAMTCLELECNQSFLGMVQLQYQTVVDVVHLVELLEKACVRFVHFSKENELRSRVFSEKMGLESGWNCHISLKSSGDSYPLTRHKTVVSKEQPVLRVNKSEIQSESTKKTNGAIMTANKALRASLPGKLNRPTWLLDFPKWQDNRIWSNNGANLGQQQRSITDGSEYKDTTPLTHPSESRGQSVTSDSDPFEYDMSNRAQLPRGIENIRPHLETMDNVPLLVSLFTDCTQETTTEMLKIMQEYGEVVCVMGSAANYLNIPIFLQSDASVAIEPRYPQLCQAVPVFKPPKGGPSPVAISQLLLSVASSLSFRMEDEISIIPLIMEARSVSLALLKAIKFWSAALVFLASLQFISLMMALPPFIDLPHIFVLSVIFVPILSLALMGTVTDSNVMNISTGKNVVNINYDVIKYVLWCYGSRFVVALVILSTSHLLNVLRAREVCRNHEDSEQDRKVYYSDENKDLNCPIWQSWSSSSNSCMTVLYLLCISLSFISRSHQLWQRHPGHNMWWSAVVFISVVLIVVHIALKTILEGIFRVWWVTVAFQVLGLFVVLGVNELVKRQEIRVEVRHQKRERLEFGTKLGMNSPF